MGTLKLKGTTDAKGTDDFVTPDFDPNALFGEVGGMDGVRYVQGKSLFGNVKQYVGPAPEHMWLAPLTKEQSEQARKRDLANKKFFGASGKTLAPGAAIPQAVINAERENAQARAAESQAA